MHQDAAGGVVAWASIEIRTGDANTSLAHSLDVLTLVRELGRVVENENRTVGRVTTLACCLEMPRENLRFADSVVIEESICRLGIRPILAYQRNAIAWT